MVRYLIPRLAESVVTFVLVTIVVFIGVRALPGDPARALAGEENDPAQVAAVRHSFGLDQPLPVQYLKYVGNALHGRCVPHEHRRIACGGRADPVEFGGVEFYGGICLEHLREHGSPAGSGPAPWPSPEVAGRPSV